jgi:hypothetical protein
MPQKPVSEMTEAELRKELLQYRIADGSKFDRDGTPIKTGSVCTFYAAPTRRATLRIRVVDILPQTKGMVEGEILEVLDEPQLWRNERRLHPPTCLLVVEQD